MNQLTDNRDFYTTTETSREYIDYGRPVQSTLFRRTAANELVEADLLIQNRYRDTLSVDAATKMHDCCKQLPTPTTERRQILPIPGKCDFKQYSSQLAQCYPRHFCDIPTHHIRQLLADRNRTVYHQDYCSPNEGIVSMRTRKRDAITNARLPSGWLIDTTYQSSYRSINDISQIGEISKTESCKPTIGSEEKLNAKLREIFKMGKSEYTERLGDEADLSVELGRYGTPKRVGYFDRYTKTE